MTSEGAKALVLLAVALVGVALVAVPWLPAERPAALPPTFTLDDSTGRQLRSVLQWHDEACRQGDLAEFEARVTERYARTFTQRLQALGRTLDPASLRAYGGEPGRGLADAVVLRSAGGFAAGNRACLIAAAWGGVGGQGFVFAWDGRVFRLDAQEHAPALAVDDRKAVAAFAERLLGN